MRASGEGGSGMSERRYSADDLDRMSPEARSRTFDESVRTDLKDLPPHLRRLVDNAEGWLKDRDTAAQR